MTRRVRSATGSTRRASQLNGDPLDPAATYRIVTNNFLADGGDAFTVFTEGTNRVGGGDDLRRLDRLPRREHPGRPTRRTGSPASDRRGRCRRRPRGGFDRPTPPLPYAEQVRRRSWRVVAQTFGACLRYRVTGLGRRGRVLRPPVAAAAGLRSGRRHRLRRPALRRDHGRRVPRPGAGPGVAAADPIRPSTACIAPTLDDVLFQGRFEIISIGFVIALWSGSRAVNVVVDTITIMYGLAGHRSILRTRALSFSLYLVFLVAAVILLPLVLAGPGLVDRVLPDRLDARRLPLLAGRPARHGRSPWPRCTTWPSPCVRAGAADLPGAALTLLLWLGRQRPAPAGARPVDRLAPRSTVRWPRRSPC